MGLEVPAQSHAGVLGSLPAGKNLIIAQQRSLVLWIQDLQCADLKAVHPFQTLNLFNLTVYWLFGYQYFRHMAQMSRFTQLQ